MAKERLIAAEAHADDEVSTPPSIRPRRLDEYIGQPELVERLSIAIDAARRRGEAIDHCLLHGPPGLGKTTLAHVIANEMEANVHVTSGPALTKGGDLVGTLTKMKARDVLFIDEIHRLPAAVEEFIYPAMEDFRIDFTLDTGMHARVMTLNLEPFTLIGATTRPGLLTGALRSRFGMAHHLRLYDERELTDILRRAVYRMEMPVLDDDALVEIARRSRGTPRITLRLLRRVRDYAEVRADGIYASTTVGDALNLERIDTLGLDDLDRTYLRTIGEVYEGGPVGVEAIAASIGEDAGTLEDMVEPYLLQIGFLARTRQGRCLTSKSASYIDVALGDAASLFE